MKNTPKTGGKDKGKSKAKKTEEEYDELSESEDTEDFQSSESEYEPDKAKWKRAAASSKNVKKGAPPSSVFTIKKVL